MLDRAREQQLLGRDQAHLKSWHNAFQSFVALCRHFTRRNAEVQTACQRRPAQQPRQMFLILASNRAFSSASRSPAWPVDAAGAGAAAAGDGLTLAAGAPALSQ